MATAANADAPTNQPRSEVQSVVPGERPRPVPPPARIWRSRDTARLVPPPAAVTATGNVPVGAFDATTHAMVTTPGARNSAAVTLTPTPAGNPHSDRTTGSVYLACQVAVAVAQRVLP